MSKLIEKLRKTSHAAPRRMGFGAIAAEGAVSAPVVLIAELTSLSDARAAKEAGADAIYLQASSPSNLSALEAAVKETELPVGLALAAVTPDMWTTLGEHGYDYVTVGLDSAARALDLQSMGLLLEVPLDTDDFLLRTLEQLPVDALVIGDGLNRQVGLTIQCLMSYQRLALLTRRPIMLRVEGELSAVELGLLRDAGVQAILAHADSGESQKTLSALRQAIKNIPPRRRKREERPEPFIPTAAPSSEIEEPEEIPSPPDMPD
ncbi:MAG: hypothetical protein EPO21_21750 [Chloroflexota bacterium]|nr:MAG: hypothetical protein EPO21_21750 [Chloroflexota bacterium]